MLEYIKFYHNMQYQVDPTDQPTKKAENLIFGSWNHSIHITVTSTWSLMTW